MSKWILQPEPALQHYTVEWAQPGCLLISRRNQLFRTANPSAPFEKIGTVPVPLWKTLSTHLRPASRLLRFSFYNAMPLGDGSVFFTFARMMGLIRDGEVRLLEGVPHNCRVQRAASALEPDGTLVFGEYFRNIDRVHPVYILVLPRGSTRVEVAHRFEAGVVRHIHGIYKDPYADGLWCTTGDVGDECKIIRSTDRFKTLDLIGGGDESWRCVSLSFSPDAIYYGTDAEFQPNYLYRLDRKTGRRDILTEVDGPVFYTHAIGQDRFFSVAAELCPSQKGRAAWLWHVSPSDQCEPVVSMEKDWYSRKFFQSGLFYFPAGPSLGTESFVYAIAVSGADDRTFRLKRADTV